MESFQVLLKKASGCPKMVYPGNGRTVREPHCVLKKMLILENTLDLLKATKFFKLKFLGRSTHALEYSLPLQE